MLLNCLPFPIAGRARGVGLGRGTALLSALLSDVASQSAYSESFEAEVEVESRDEEELSRDLDVESRDEETVIGEQESGPSGASAKKPRLHGETDVPNVEPTEADRPIITPNGIE